MYHDENNLYHYTYEKGAPQPGQNIPAQPTPPYAQEDAAHRSSQSYQSYQSGQYHSGGYYQSSAPVAEPPKKKRRGAWKTVALALVCSLLGGAVGSGAMWAANRSAHESSQVFVSSTPATVVEIKTVDGATAMSDAEVYAANVNSVVSINVTGTAGTNFFGQAVQTASSGSGFVLTSDGYIVTNYHVVENADTVMVTMYNGDEFEAKYIGGDEDYDIAVIKVSAQDLQAVTLGDSDNLNVGDHVLAIGNPLGELTFSMSGGMVSSVNRAINVDGTPFNMIQTDASINSGNSGGPLFNQFGEVVGIVSAKYSSTSSGTSVEGLGFAIPMNDVFAMIEDIMTNGYVTNKPYMGITPGSMTEQMAAQYRYDVTTGVFVYSVEKGSAADKAGLKMGDVILKVNDDVIKDVDGLNTVKKKYAAGDTVTLTIYREGAETTVELTWDAVPADQQVVEDPQSSSQYDSQYGNPYSNPYGYYSPFDSFFRFFGGY